MSGALGYWGAAPEDVGPGWRAWLKEEWGLRRMEEHISHTSQPCLGPVLICKRPTSRCMAALTTV